MSKQAADPSGAPNPARGQVWKGAGPQDAEKTRGGRAEVDGENVLPHLHVATALLQTMFGSSKRTIADLPLRAVPLAVVQPAWRNSPGREARFAANALTTLSQE